MTDQAQARATFFDEMRPLFKGGLTPAQVRVIDGAIDRLLDLPPKSLACLQPVDTAGLLLIQEFEGLHDSDKATAILEPQMDPIGIWTIGWGYALFDGGRALTGAKDKARAFALWKDMFPAGMTRTDADWLVLKVIAEWMPKLDALLVRPLTQGQSNALISLAYNVGIGIKDGKKGDLADSSLVAAINAGWMDVAADRFLDWKYAGGKELPGLVRRRKAERAVFLGVAR